MRRTASEKLCFEGPSQKHRMQVTQSFCATGNQDDFHSTKDTAIKCVIFHGFLWVRSPGSKSFSRIHVTQASLISFRAFFVCRQGHGDQPDLWHWLAQTKLFGVPSCSVAWLLYERKDMIPACKRSTICQPLDFPLETRQQFSMLLFLHPWE